VAAIAKMIVTLAVRLGLSVIAEGVEVEAQRQFLARHAYQRDHFIGSGLSTQFFWKRTVGLVAPSAFLQNCHSPLRL